MEYDPSKMIVVCGYPKSGNTYMSRLIGQMLDSPVGGWKNAVPLATEGERRTGKYRIAQLHLFPRYNSETDEALPTGWDLNIPMISKERVVYVTRDPRDIAVSSKFYWDLPTFRIALDAMYEGSHPLARYPWNEYIHLWTHERENIPQFSWVKYEDLLSNPRAELKRIFDDLDLPYPKRKTDVMDIIESQSFKNKVEQVSRDGDARPYGKGIQLKLLRKGVSGDWKNYFSNQDINVAKEYFAETMSEIGYEFD